MALKLFKYKAKDKSGNTVKGEVEASTDSQAASLLRERNLTIISITPKTDFPFSSVLSSQSRVSKSDVSNFTRQFSTMVVAGLPLTESLLILRSQSSGIMQKTVSQILADVEEGQPLSSAMGKHPKMFTKTYVTLVRAGEAGGVLDEVLLRLADNLEKEQEFSGKVKSAMIYPIIIVVGMVIVSVVMLVFVIPRLTDLYDQFDATLPIPTQILVSMSQFMINFWPLVLVMIGVMVYGYRIYRGTQDGRRKIDELSLLIPIIGDLKRKIMLTELSRTLSLMVGSGVSILESLSISSGVVNNKVMSEALDSASDMVEKGFPVALAFSKHPKVFPFIFSQMIAVGEETGKLDEVLAKISHVFEVESNQKVKGLTSAIEPIILLILGVGVAFLVIAVIMPIYNLTTQI